MELKKEYFVFKNSQCSHSYQKIQLNSKPDLRIFILESNYKKLGITVTSILKVTE